MDVGRWKKRKPRNAGKLEDMLSDFKTDSCRRVAEAYLGLLEKDNGSVPAKNSFDLTGFASVMPDLALTAIVKPDRCVFRLVGENLRRRLSFDPIGQNYYDFVPEARRTQAIQALHMVIDVPCAFRAEIEQHYSDDHCRLIEAVGFPLTSSEPDIAGFILFGDKQFDGDMDWLTEGQALLGANVVKRDLIDLGFGIDQEFEDVVPA